MGRGSGGAIPIRGLGNQQLQQRLLRVAAVLGLLPDALTRAIHHLGRDLLAGVGGQVVHRKRPRRRRIQQRVVDAVVRQRLTPLN